MDLGARVLGWGQAMTSAFWADPPPPGPSNVDLVMSVSVFTLNPKAVTRSRTQGSWVAVDWSSAPPFFRGPSRT